MKVSVTDYHIRTGRRCLYTSCPVANAITPLLPAGQEAHVYHDAVIVKNREKWPVTSALFPEDVQKWILAFDEGKPVSPIEFEINFLKQ